jgi:hypothetical protein
MRFGALWRPTEPLDRGPYLLLGVVLSLVKYQLDRLALMSVSPTHVWSPWSYWMPGDVFGVFSVARERQAIAGTLVAIALPFVAVGVWLTFKRLRSLAWPGWLVAVFFIPFVNLVFFALLSVLPERAPRNAPPGAAGFIARLVPRSPVGAATAAVGITAVLTTSLMFLSLKVLNTYGWSLFVGVPFFLGLFSTLILCLHEPQPLKNCMGVGALSIAIVCGLLIALAIEGIICTLMAAPILMALALFGSFIGYVIVRSRISSRETGSYAGALLVAMPFLMGAEADLGRPVREEVVIDETVLAAPPEEVWEMVKAIDEIRVPRPFLLRFGAVPLYCTLERDGVGAMRTCHFDRGVIEERIDEWDPPRKMGMSIVRTTLPGRPWLKFVRATYELRPEGGGTRLIRTTSYTSILHPAIYWRTLEGWGFGTAHRYLFAELARRSER